MAIYRTGQASMDANGYITGYGTKWKTALTLIRPGATIVFASNPVAYATISEIVNDTSLRATSTGGAVVPRGDYVILLHDSITVDGLAQDVAETLRYYQGQETMYQEFVEFLKGFDWQKLEEIERNTEANASAADASAKAAAQSESNANASKNAAAASATTSSQQASAAASSASAAKVSENNAASSKTAAANSASAAANSATTASHHKDAAAASASAAKTSETNANASKTAAASSASAAKTSETNAKSSETNAASSASAANTAKNEAQTAASSANASKSAAAASATTATQQADRAKAEADRAQTANPDNQLKKANNLSDVANMNAARQNMLVDRLLQEANYTKIDNPAKDYNFFVGANGLWGVGSKSTGARVALGVAEGGTGATSADGARNNLQLGSGDHVEFYNVKTRGGLNMLNNSGNISPSLVAQVFDTSGANLLGQVELRANANGSAVLINRTSGTPRDIVLGSDGVVNTLGLTAARNDAAITVRAATAGSAHYVLFNDGSENTGYVGNPSNSHNDIGLWNYQRNAGIQIGDRIRLNGLDTNLQGNLFVDGSSAYVRGGEGNSNTHFWLQNRSGRTRAVMYSSDVQVLTLRSDNVGTGTSGQSFQLNGATGECRAVQFTSTSDERAKFWIKPVTGALDKICSLRGVTYSMHTTIQNTVRNAGVIAQDVQKVLPEAVSVGETGSTLDKDCFQVENPLSLDYNALSALYVEAFKEMRGIIEAHRAEIEALKAEIMEIKK